MCITRVGRVLSKDGIKAIVKFLDDNLKREVDVSMLADVKKNSYVEIFSDTALNILTQREALWKKKIWIELRQKAIG